MKVKYRKIELDSITIERFWKKVAIRSKSECWLWIGANNGRKEKARTYGTMKVHGTLLSAHRISYCIAHTEFSQKLDVLHSCDIPLCVNPNHLWEGTLTDNMRDKESKGRGNHPFGDRSGARTHPESHARGERAGNAKLTQSQVNKIRELIRQGIPTLTISKTFHITNTNIYQIRDYKIWKD